MGTQPLTIKDCQCELQGERQRQQRRRKWRRKQPAMANDDTATRTTTTTITTGEALVEENWGGSPLLSLRPPPLPGSLKLKSESLRQAKLQSFRRRLCGDTQVHSNQRPPTTGKGGRNFVGTTPIGTKRAPPSSRPAAAAAHRPSKPRDPRNLPGPHGERPNSAPWRSGPSRSRSLPWGSSSHTAASLPQKKNMH